METAREVLATHIQEEESVDEWGWAPTTTGNYSTNSGYWLLHGQHLNNPTLGKMVEKETLSEMKNYRQCFPH